MIIIISTHFKFFQLVHKFIYFAVRHSRYDAHVATESIKVSHAKIFSVKFFPQPCPVLQLSLNMHKTSSCNCVTEAAILPRAIFQNVHAT